MLPIVRISDVFRHKALAVWAALISTALATLCLSTNLAVAASDVRLTLDRPIDGAAAPFIVAATRGLYRQDGLNVVIDNATGSHDAITRVASGASDIALADINSLIRFRDAPNAPPVTAVFVLFNKAPYALIARKSRGITTFADVTKKTLGFVEADQAVKLWPTLVRLNGVNPATVKIEKISAAVREPMLSAGQVDAVTGWSYLSAINLRDHGVPASDLIVLRFADFGSQVYGHALIANPKFAADNPDAVKAFLRATVAGIRLSIKDPKRAIDDVIPRMSGASHELELERLQAVIQDNLLSEEVRRNGIGDIDAKRFDLGLDQIAEGYEFQRRPSLSEIFDSSFLPSLNGRKIY